MNIVFGSSELSEIRNLTVEDAILRYFGPQRVTQADVQPVTSIEPSDSKVPEPKIPEKIIEEVIVDYDVIKHLTLKAFGSGKKDEVLAIYDHYGIRELPKLPESLRGEYKNKIEALLVEDDLV